MAIFLRAATVEDTDEVAAVWHDAWHDGHGNLVPAAWRKLRNRENFRMRAPALIPHMIVAVDEAAGAEGNDIICGFVTTEDNSLEDLFVAATHRGTGVAARLLRAGEEQLAAAGVTTAELQCTQGNDRAQRFYEKMGWQAVRPGVQEIDTPDGRQSLDNWIMEKSLA
ncbi:GNAT family N-acetyltransferase [Hwanghaeella grinnelliae]|uniref:GNAT family N-acetyltransferase n=1 Tax=Hwanghaeella grinnelliae TaxID=2500179 RepID=A0A437QX22_9PROT|nr:GNAT family N-acetyltransferase [Hwanghaeella grinnelliae]RVU39077.1 GNAT family N-acetyltransferase [Hwanghaeella grinnelliae]